MTIITNRSVLYAVPDTYHDFLQRTRHTPCLVARYRRRTWHTGHHMPW